MSDPRSPALAATTRATAPWLGDPRTPPSAEQLLQIQAQVLYVHQQAQHGAYARAQDAAADLEDWLVATFRGRSGMPLDGILADVARLAGAEVDDLTLRSGTLYRRLDDLLHAPPEGEAAA